MMLAILELGEEVVDLILSLAALITGDGMPGIISLGLVATLILVSIYYSYRVWRFQQAIGYFAEKIPGSEWSVTEEKIVEIDRDFKELRKKKGWEPHLAIAWGEFRETTVGSDRLRNTVRPSVFFSRDELGLERGFWRLVPGLFVSLGLLLTFMGLVAALQQTSDILNVSTAREGTDLEKQALLQQTSDILDVGTESTVQGLTTLLTIASAKFIMSLTGLLCSILFTFVVRIWSYRLDVSLSRFCARIEGFCEFVSQQSLQEDMLKTLREQTIHLQSFSTELVAQIARPLKEDLPMAIRASMEEFMGPALEKLAHNTGQGVEALAGNVSERLAEGIESAVVNMKQTVEGVARGLEQIAERMDGSSSVMSSQIEQSVRALATNTENLESLLSGASKQAASAFEDAAEAMVLEVKDALNQIEQASGGGATQMLEAASKIAENISGLEDSVLNSANASGKQILSAGQAMASGMTDATEEMRKAMIAPMELLFDKVADLSSTVASASSALGKYSDSIEMSAIRVVEANEQLDDSSKALGTVARPLAEASSKIQDAVESTHRALNAVAEEFRGLVADYGEIVGNYDKMDTTLGSAFKQFETAVSHSVEELRDFERELNKRFGDALNRLETAIQMAEPFKPRRERT